MHTKFPLHSPDFYAGDPYPVYRELRATSPVCWNDVTKFWALLKYEDVRFVSSDPALFSSAKGITIPDPAIPSPVQEGNLIFADPPRHRQMRKLINSGFTRRRVACSSRKSVRSCEESLTVSNRAPCTSSRKKSPLRYPPA